EELVDQLCAGAADAECSSGALGMIVSEERLRLRRQMLAYRAPGAQCECSWVRGDEMVIFEDRHRVGRGSQPQPLTHQGEGDRIQTLLELHVTVTMHTDLSPDAQVRRYHGQILHQWPFECEVRQRLLPRAAVDAKSRLM